MLMNGIGTSRGIAIGHAYMLVKQVLDMSYHRVEDVAESIHILKMALEKAKEQIGAIKEKTRIQIGEKESLIFEAHLLILEDPEYLGAIEDILHKEHSNVPYAVEQVRHLFEGMFLAMDSAYMRERAADINDVSKRLMNCASGIEETYVLPEQAIVFCEDLEPSDTVTLGVDAICGIVTEKGGETSHSAIIAKSMGIPAISKIKMNALTLRSGTQVIIDGQKGVLIIDPTEAELNQYRQLQKEFLKTCDQYEEGKMDEARTLDGVPMEISANIAGVDRITDVIHHGADGVGLFRTEFLYMNRQTPPTEDEQFEVYKTALEAFGNKPMVIRTFDIGGDKVIDYLAFEKEMNPFLGYRAVRISLDRPDLFRVQLRALYRASVYGNLKIMVPMISSIEEVMALKDVVESVKEELAWGGIHFDHVELGIMVEIPAVAVQADKFAKYVDFFSIGTNDLLQYTVAVDRMNEKLTHLYSRYHPALLSMIQHVAHAGKKAGIWVGICGEAAADPLLLPFYVGVGITELSMSSQRVAETKWRLRNLKKSDAVVLTQKVLEFDTMTEVKAFLTTVVTAE